MKFIEVDKTAFMSKQQNNGVAQTKTFFLLLAFLFIR
jgi:hypothetical protein